MGKRDFYEVLGVSKDASSDEIKKAYRRLAQRYHPDRNKGDKVAEDRFKDINEAYQVLSDPEKRSQYNAFGHGYANYGGNPPGAGPGPGPGYTYSYSTGPEGFGVNLEDLFGGFTGPRRSRKGKGGFRDIFSDMFGHGGFDFAESGPQDIEAEMTISFEDAIRGGTHTLELGVPENCNSCGGTGRVNRSVCGACAGSGHVMRPEKFTVRIPAGVRDRGRLRIPGKGITNGTGKKGDLHIRIHVQPHRFFRRDGDDIHLDVPITITEAALGARITVPTVDGKATLRIPRGTQSGQTMRLRNKGVKHPKGGGRGDQFVHIQIQVPKQLDERTRRLLEELRTLETDDPRKHLV